jgi:protease secretion system membrane fusion protein
MSQPISRSNKQLSTTTKAVVGDDLSAIGVELHTDTGPTVLLGLLTILFGFGGFLVWAAYAPLDEGVPAPAQVTIDTKRKTIQHLTGGNILNVAVREGQQVKAGDVLVELNAGEAKANYESIRQTYMAQRAAESRLLAELQNASAIRFHPDLVAASSDPLVRQHIETQTQVFQARRNSLMSEVKAIEESILGQEAALAGIKAQQESRKLQASKQFERLKSFGDLAKDGYVSRNQVLQLEQEQADLASGLAELESARIRVGNAINELQSRKAQRRQDFLKESGVQLAEVSRDVLSGRERLDAIKDQLSRVVIKAPVDGQVVGLALSSAGGIVSPGQRLMDIVPQDESVVLETKFTVNVIDRIKVGDPVAVRFSTFAHSPQLVVDGILLSISGDVLTESTSTGTASFYLGRVQVTKNGLQQLGSRSLKPGMAAEVLVTTGERSLLTYLMGPLLKRISAAMREE